MSLDDVVYVLLLVGSIPLGLYVQQITNRNLKQRFCTLVGLAVVVSTCRFHALHSLVTTLGNCCIVKFVSVRYCHKVSFGWCFLYLAFFRSTHLFGIPSPPALANAVQLLLTLKMVMVAFEVHESTYPLKDKKTADMDPEELSMLRQKYVNVDPSFLDIFHYGYCFLGLLTGPFYRYRTYLDMLNQGPGLIPWKSHLANRLKPIPILVVIFVLVSRYFDKSYTQADEFLEEPFWFRLFYIVPMFTIFRARLYIAFLLSECMCMTAGLGGYPVKSKPRCGIGPTDLQVLDQIVERKSSDVEYDFETIHNLDIYGCELAPQVRDGLKAWNMTVQSWLAHCVYKRFPIRSLGSTVTLTVSAFWHGIHPGYYISFLTCVPILIAEDMWSSVISSAASPQQQKVWSWFSWFMKMRYFDYMCMGFILLSWQATMHFWGSVYFTMHIVIMLYLISGYIVKSRCLNRHKQL